MADEVKLITFAGETVSPLYDGLMQELYTGGGGIITGAVVTIKDASTLHITGGYGREFEIFASDIPVTLSSSGTLKGRLYLHMDLAQSGAPIELLVEVASSLTPVVQDSDVNTTNGVYEVNLATFDIGTSAISNLVDVSPKLSKIPDQISSLNSAISTLNSRKWTFLTAIQANGTYTVPDLSQYKEYQIRVFLTYIRLTLLYDDIANLTTIFPQWTDVDKSVYCKIQKTNNKTLTVSDSTISSMSSGAYFYVYAK